MIPKFSMPLLCILVFHSFVPAKQSNIARSRCGSSNRRIRRDDLEVLGHQFNSGPSFYDVSGKSAYFSGNEIIEFMTQIDDNKFTIELWVKPEGGQISDAPILNFCDRCQGKNGFSIWKLGMKNFEKGRDSRVYFNLKTHRDKDRHMVAAHRGYRPGIWMHIAVVFNGTSVKLFINQAQVSVSHKKHSPVTAARTTQCQILEMGGDSRRAAFFRGSVDNLRIWKKAKSQRAIIADIFRSAFGKSQGELNLFENFDRLDSGYFSVTKSLPILVRSTIPEDLNHIEVRRPFCGETVCDNADIIRGYKENEFLRHRKVLRYRIVSLAYNDGKNPIVSQRQIKKQHQKLNEVFSKYNISWDVNVHVVRNTTLRKRVILIDCETWKIGDGFCNKECDLRMTGYDGRDCEPCKKCNIKLLNNRRCDQVCNNACNGYDAGECCDERYTDTSQTCFDPKSPNRAYVTIAELKNSVNLDNTYQLNVFTVNFAHDVFEGYATFPWEKNVYDIEGGTLLQASRFGEKDGFNIMVHELGHNLGLLHVHHGFDRCSNDPCFEKYASMELGDLCQDTNPTPRNEKCEDPTSKDTCGLPNLKNTPFMNFMGYGGKCTNEFTHDQVARMHCYADFMYQTWSIDDIPSAIPMKPTILSFIDQVLKIEWMQSFGLGYEFTARNCNRCDSRDATFRQFAATATSSSASNHMYHPTQATGPPDAKKCSLDPFTFVSIQEQGSTKMTFLELGFQKEVVPIGIKIWVTYSRDGIPIDVEILHTDKSITYLGSAVTQCDVPYTRKIFTEKPTKTVRIGIHDSETGIDAIELISEENHAHCRKCPRIEYIVNREPPFQSRQPVRVPIRRFTDREVKHGITYEYRIQTVVGHRVGPPSASLKFHSNSGFCGDGIIQSNNGEECDDGNLRDGDGCSIQCKKEDVFQCKGQPSICYRNEGDGICESFERETVPVDCGFYIPNGFTQQWAIAATGNPIHECEHSKYDIITGPPPLDLKCFNNEQDATKKAWFPCLDIINKEDHYWIEASFAEPVVAAAVVVYLASDGLSFITRANKNFMNITLRDESNSNHSIGTNNIEVNCKQSPLVIPVLHDMTKPYFKTKYVRISYSVYNIAISSIALRSSDVFNPLIASLCDITKSEFYNKRTHHCHWCDCNLPKCEPLVIKNANIICKGSNDGDTCKITCAIGYLPEKTVVAKCILGKWLNAHVKCVPVNCGKPRIKRAIVDCRKGTTYKRFCTINCIPPSRLIGVSNKIKCMADGLWSVRRASCQLHCPLPQMTENSYAIDFRCDSNHMKARRMNEMGTECKFQCNPGFILTPISSNVVGKFGRMTCDEDGSWMIDAKCVRLRCSELSFFDKLVYNCSNSNIFDSICTTMCPQNKEVHQVRCQEDGQWSSGFDYCKYKGSCNPVSNELNLDSCNYQIRSSCKPTCMQKGFDVVLRGEEDLNDVTLTCMPDMKWHPPTDRVYCLASCNKKSLGDGICDCNQNNKHCNYDNGDCCAASLKRTKIVKFSNNVPCKCRDPDVLEAMSRAGSGDGGTIMNNGDNEDDDYDDHDDVNMGNRDKIEVMSSFM